MKEEDVGVEEANKEREWTHREAEAEEKGADDGRGEYGRRGHARGAGDAANRTCGRPPGLPPDDGMSPTDV
jgi:hypothetical protein